MNESESSPQKSSATVQELEKQLADLRRQMMHLEKMSTVGVLASSITHEFNNILTTVINYAKMGLRHEDDATRKKAFDKILTAGQRAAKITTGMLSYARHRDDRQETHSLQSLIDDVLVLVEKDLQKHRITLTKNVQDDVFARVNPNQIQQVLLNLVINARQAMEPGGSLTIEVTADDTNTWALVSVSDTGAGIPGDQLPKIFDEFYSTKSADESGQGGSGLGLALCKSIIESHKGRIRVDSRLGHGTTFTLKLPLAREEMFLSGETITGKAG